MHFLVEHVAESRAIFPRCTPTAEKCDVEHICFHSVRLLRDPSFGYPEHSNWQRGFWQCSNFTGFTHPTKQTNKQASVRLAVSVRQVKAMLDKARCSVHTRLGSMSKIESSCQSTGSPSGSFQSGLSSKQTTTQTPNLDRIVEYVYVYE